MSKFIFGTASASYQIEGARHEDGKTDSIWDEFCERNGTIANGENGDIACDHYHRYKEDVQLIKNLGASHYRFSISWPRIFPRPHEFNQKGMDFYLRLVRELTENGIKPCITLYHWDMPLWLQNIGGWENRENIVHFLEYADACFAHLDEYADMWITHNEPWCVSILSNYFGAHAPGKRDIGIALKVAHNLLVSHGETVRLYREKYNTHSIGITINLNPSVPASNSVADTEAGYAFDGTFNRWFLDPLFKKRYPSDIVSLYSKHVSDFSFVKYGDFETIAEPCDFLGINYYQASCVRADEKADFGYSTTLYEGVDKTYMDWNITPNAFGELIERLRTEYTSLPIIITENGACFKDELSPSGEVDDEKRADFILKHLEVVEQQNKKGNNVTGYFVWSIMDNFEWAMGYDKRFGVVYCDFKTLKRTPKKSYYAYKAYIENKNRT